MLPDMLKRRRRSTQLAAWALVLAWMALIFVLSSQPDADPGGRSRGFRLEPSKLGHVAVFGTLGVLVGHALVTGRSRRAGWWVLVVVASFAVLDEAHQATVPNRTPTVPDVAIDSVSGFLGWVVYRRGRRRLARRRRRARMVSRSGATRVRGASDVPDTSRGGGP
jgi:VanZ family protein